MTDLYDNIHSCSYFCDLPACIKRQRDELRDKLEAVPVWVKCSERMPEYVCQVGGHGIATVIAVTDKGFIAEAIYEDGELSMMGLNVTSIATHWVPLPQPPTKEK